jgi:hypothetical protein
MKKLIVFLFSLICCIYASAQTRYKVVTDSPIDVISGAYAGAPVIGTLENGSEVDVYESSNGWAKIKHNNDYAYVAAKSLKEVDSQVANTPQQDKGDKSFIGDVNVRWMVYLIALLSLILFGIRMIGGTGTIYLVNLIVFFATTVCELIYIILSHGTDAIWFCTPDEVGWIWTIVNFIIFVGLMYNQVLCIFTTINDIQSKSGCQFGIKLGLYSVIGGIIACIITLNFFQSLTLYVVIAVAICQIIQIIQMVKAILPGGGWGNAILCLFVYLLGVAATAAVFCYLIILLLIVVVGYFILTKFVFKAME